MTELESPFKASMLIFFLNEEGWMAYQSLLEFSRGTEPIGWIDG